MYDYIQGIIQPVISDYLVWVVLGGVGWFMRRLPARLQLDIEARHREALHKALDTAVGLALDTVQRLPQVSVTDKIVTEGLSYVNVSVPDAIKRLGPTPAMLEKMFRSKLQKTMDATLGRDRLFEALTSSGVAAKKPG